MKRWAPWLLLLALLSAQTVQAWHAPVHIHDIATASAFSFDHGTCPFGVNGHGVAATGHFRLEVGLVADCPGHRVLPVFCAGAATFFPPARGPPSFRHRVVTT